MTITEEFSTRGLALFLSGIKSVCLNQPSDSFLVPGVWHPVFSVVIIAVHSLIFYYLPENFFTR